MMNKAMLKQAQQMQAKMMKAQEELEKTVFEASSGGGAVKAVVNGHQVLQSIKIDPEAVDPDDITMLEDMVMAAVSEAMDKAKEMAASQMQSLTGGMKIPGLF